MVRFKLASEIASAITCGLMSPIYSQITPEALGEDHQELTVALEYGKRLARIGKNINENQIKHLVEEYPSHDFVIDYLEAKTLFNRVDDPTSDMMELAIKLKDLAFVPDFEIVTVLHLSKPEKTETDEAKDKGAPDAATQASSDGSSGSSDPSAA